MSILHYTIGLPPERRGGSVQVAHDLMNEQASQGLKVIALTCGDTLFRGSRVRIKPVRKSKNIEIYRLTNPLTPTLIYGVSDANSQHRRINIDRKNIKKFILNNKISVLHLHTLMGIHSDIVKIFKDNGVKIIYTTHDFHGICPHYDLLDYNGEICEGAATGVRCSICNYQEPSDLFLRIVNSDLFRIVKKTGVLTLLKQNNKLNKGNHSSSTIIMSEERKKSFDDLLGYYRDYFRLIDVFHFNSTQTREKFEKAIGSLTGKVIPVVTSGVKDLRQPLKKTEIFKFGFIGNLNNYKGFPLLKQVVKELQTEGFDKFKIKVYGSNLRGLDNDCGLIEYCAPYLRSELTGVIYDLDCVIVPSKCYETFSLVTLEALAHGRPAIVSDHVGAKDIVCEISPELIFSNKNDLKQILKECLTDSNYLSSINQKILSVNWKYTLSENAKEITKLYII